MWHRYRLRNPADGNSDVFWMSRESALLIRGGSNYAYEQINAELAAFLVVAMGKVRTTLKGLTSRSFGY